MSYLETVIKYLRDSEDRDPAVDSSCTLLDRVRAAPQHTWRQNYRELGGLLPGETRKIWGPVDELLQSPTGHNPFFLEQAERQARKAIQCAVTSIDQGAILEDVLSNAGYDVKALREAKAVIGPELEKWQKDSNYPVPIKEFFGPGWQDAEEQVEEQTSEREHRIQERARAYKALKTGVGVALLPIVLPVAAAGGILQGANALAGLAHQHIGRISKRINEARKDRKYGFGTDFNRWNGFFQGEEPDTIIYDNIVGPEKYLVVSILQGMHDKHARLEELTEKGYTAALSQDAKNAPSDAFLRMETTPVSEDWPSPFVLGHGSTRDANTIAYHKQEGMPSLSSKRLPEDLQMTSEYDQLLLDMQQEKPLEIAAKIREHFVYEAPSEGNLTRFEMALQEKKGVCQDANFWLWHALRTLGYTHSYLALGYQFEGSQVKNRDLHAKVLIQYGGEWRYIDATPQKDSTDQPTEQQDNDFIGDAYALFSGIAQEIKNGAMSVAQRAQRRIHASTLHYLEEAANDTFATVNSLEAPSQARKNLLRNLNSIDDLRGINLFHRDGTPRAQVQYNGFFNPEEVNEAINKLRYVAAAAPGYIQRFSEPSINNMLLDELCEYGELFPYTHESPEWRPAMTALLELATKPVEPPNLLQVKPPIRLTLTLKEQYRPSLLLPETITFEGKPATELEDEAKKVWNHQRYESCYEYIQDDWSATRYEHSPTVFAFDRGERPVTDTEHKVMNCINRLRDGVDTFSYGHAITRVLEAANRRPVNKA